MADTKNIDPMDMTEEEFSEYLASFNDVTDEGAEDAAADTEPQGAAEDAAEEAAEQEASPFRSFATEDEYNSTLDEYADGKHAERLSRADTDAETVSRITDLANKYYGGEDGISALIDDLENLNANNAGQDVEAYRQQEKDRRDLENYRERDREEQNRQREQEKRTQEILSGWSRQAEALRRRVPDFDLDKAFEDEGFRSLVVDEGMSIDGAYYAAQHSSAPALQRRSVPQNAAQSGARSGGGDFNDAVMNASSDREALELIRRHAGR